MNAVVQPIFRPDVDAMRFHVEHLFGGYLDGYHEGKIELAWTDTKPDDAGRYRLAHARLFGTEELEELVAEAARLNSVPMCNVYIGAALRHPDTAPFGRCQDSDAWALTATYTDLDDPGAATAAKDIYGLDKPTLVVLTGREPHVRAQLWWRLDEPLTSPEHWPNLLRGIATKLNADPTVANSSRVMRLAGTIAWPAKPGRTIETTSIVPLKEPGAAFYAVEHLAKVFPPAVSETSPAPFVSQQYRVNSLGLSSDRIIDGRESYMRNTISACLIEYVGETGAAPTPAELYDIAWPQYERKVDLTRSGRGADEFRRKCNYTVARFNRGDIRGIETLDKAIEVYRRKRRDWSQRTPQEEVRRSEDALSTSSGADDVGPFRASSLHGAPPPREWVVNEWVPAGTVTSIYGDGGVGKTLLAQQLLYAAGTGGKWLGFDIPKSRTLGVFCEDDKDELHRRHDDIRASMGASIGNPFDDVWLWPRVGFDNLLVTFDRDSKPTMSPLFERTMTAVLENQIGLLILDTAADLFGGNEIIRGQVNYFIKAVCGSYIRRAKEAGFGLTVVILAHPSQAGRNSGSGESGSTGWSNAVRSRLYLTKPEDGLPEQRVLTRKKSNYSASGDDIKLDLFWSEGVLKPVDTSQHNRLLVASLEQQICSLIGEAWRLNDPYKGKKGHPKHLDKCMVEAFKTRFDVAVVVAALVALKSKEMILLEREGDRRGWRLPSIKKGRQDVE